jgi:putative membrane protein
VVTISSPFSPASPETAAGRQSLEELRGDIIDGADLVRIAEAELHGCRSTCAQERW